MAVDVKMQQMVTELVAAERSVQQLDREASTTGMVNERKWQEAKRALRSSVARLQRAVAR